MRSRRSPTNACGVLIFMGVGAKTGGAGGSDLDPDAAISMEVDLGVRAVEIVSFSSSALVPKSSSSSSNRGITISKRSGES